MLRGFMVCVILLLVASSVLAKPKGPKALNRSRTNSRVKTVTPTSLTPRFTDTVGKNFTMAGAGKGSGPTNIVIGGAAVTTAPVVEAVSNASTTVRKRTTKKSRVALKPTTKVLKSSTISNLPSTTSAIDETIDTDEDDLVQNTAGGDNGLVGQEGTSPNDSGVDAASQSKVTDDPVTEDSVDDTNEVTGGDHADDSSKKNVVSTAVPSKNMSANSTVLPMKATTTAKALIVQTTSNSKPKVAPAGAEESDEQKQIETEQDEDGSMEHSLEAEQVKPAAGSEADSAEIEDAAPVTTHNSEESLEAAGPVPGVDQDEQDVSKHEEEEDGEEDVSANKPPSKFETDNEKYPSGYEAHDDDEDSWLPGSSSFMTYFLIGSSVIFVTYFVYHYRSRIAGRCFACFLEGRRGGRSTGARQRQRSANGRNNSGSGGESATVEYKPLRSTEKD